MNGAGEAMAPGRGALNQPDAVSALNELTAHMGANLSRTQELSHQLENIGDRILGPVPPSPTSGGPETGPGSKLEELRVLAVQQENALDYLREQINRLESL